MPVRQYIESYVTLPEGRPIDFLREVVEAAGGSIEQDFVHAVVHTVDPPELNRERLINVLAWATAQEVLREHGLPSEWDQGQWFRTGEGVAAHAVPGWDCGTSCCIAGKVVIDAGGKPDFTAGFNDATAMVVMPESAYATAADSTARDLLGLTQKEAALLFAGSNKLRDVRRLITDLLEGQRTAYEGEGYIITGPRLTDYVPDDHGEEG